MPEHVHRASANIAALISGNADIFYLNARIEFVKFYIESLHLWLVNGRKRLISFLPNKVNVITGDSHTGKTAILDIVDYCLFASRHRISESIINENVLWYGLCIHVNDKVYMLARRAPVGPATSQEYHFSSVGDVPDGAPDPNIQEGALKKLLSADFGIDQDVKIPFGGRVLQAGSRISLRYFLLFNTISQNIITHSEQFFDKQDQERYQEALPRIFDIAVGIDTVENILKREKRVRVGEAVITPSKSCRRKQEKTANCSTPNWLKPLPRQRRMGSFPTV